MDLMLLQLVVIVAKKQMQRGWIIQLIQVILLLVRVLQLKVVMRLQSDMLLQRRVTVLQLLVKVLQLVLQKNKGVGLQLLAIIQWPQQITQQLWVQKLLLLIMQP